MKQQSKEKKRSAAKRKGVAKYGKQIFSTLSGKLSADYGRGFSQQNLFRMS